MSIIPNPCWSPKLPQPCNPSHNLPAFQSASPSSSSQQTSLNAASNAPFTASTPVCANPCASPPSEQASTDLGSANFANQDQFLASTRPSASDFGLASRDFAPKFSSLYGSGKNISYEQNILTITSFLRFPDQFLAIPLILKKHFPNGAKIFDYACSDGSEAYSIALILNYAGFTADKYPILGKDISPYAISFAKSGYLLAHSGLFDKIQKLRFTSLEPSDCFTEIPAEQKEAILDQVITHARQEPELSDWWTTEDVEEIRQKILDSNLFFYKVGDTLLNRVQFDLGDLARDSLDSEKPSLILFNAALMYLNVAQQTAILSNIYQNTAPSSMLLIADGHFADFKSGIEGKFIRTAESLGFDVTHPRGNELILTKPLVEKPPLAVAGDAEVNEDWFTAVSALTSKESSGSRFPWSRGS